MQKKIFDPFFTTKEVGEGTGLGLAVTLSLVQRLGGQIDVASQSGKGSTFTLILPLERACLKAPAEPSAQGSVHETDTAG